MLSAGSTSGRRELQAKKTVREILDRLPDDCSLDEVLYQLYVVQAVNRGRTDVASGRTLSHEEVARELRKKWRIGAAG
jgi:hypothetical protein